MGRGAVHADLYTFSHAQESLPTFSHNFFCGTQVWNICLRSSMINQNLMSGFRASFNHKAPHRNIKPFLAYQNPMKSKKECSVIEFLTQESEKARIYVVIFIYRIKIWKGWIFQNCVKINTFTCYTGYFISYKEYLRSTLCKIEPDPNPKVKWSNIK